MAVKEQVASGMGGLYGNGKKLLAEARQAREAYEHGRPPKHPTFMPNVSAFTRAVASLSPKYRDMLKAIDYYEDRSDSYVLPADPSQRQRDHDREAGRDEDPCFASGGGPVNFIEAC